MMLLSMTNEIRKILIKKLNTLFELFFWKSVNYADRV